MMQSRLKHWILLAIATLLWAAFARAEVSWPRVALSADGTPVSYQVHGAGELTLVLIHGWNCDSRYWRAQVDYFASSHRVIVVDLAGHGHSGQQREQYTMTAFGQDVRAVIEAEAVERAVLVGHSMGGAVSLAAAAALPDRVAGIIGIDTFHDLGQRPSPADIEAMVGPLRSDFSGNARAFVADMFISGTDTTLREWIIADMSAAPPRVAVSAVQQLFEFEGDQTALTVLREKKIPVLAINADLWPTNLEANTNVLPGFQAVILPGSDHFLHMARAADLNRVLARMIANL